MPSLQIYEFLLQNIFLFAKVKKKGKFSPTINYHNVKVYMRHEGTATAIHKLSNRYKCIVNLTLWLLPPWNRTWEVQSQTGRDDEKKFLLIFVCEAE
jgi:hypothetical protein